MTTRWRAARFALATMGMAALGAGCGGGGGPAATATPTPVPSFSAAPTVTPTATPEATPTPTAAPTPAPTPATATAQTSIYLVRNGVVQPVHRLVAPATVAHDAVLALVAGPTAEERSAGMSSDVPTSTHVYEVSIVGSAATVDVSAQFTGGSVESASTAVAQVVFTVTQYRAVQSVMLLVEGMAVPRIGGVPTGAPLTRASVEKWAPAILVESPLPGDTVSSPLRIWGTANTFEAVFRIRMTTGTGEQLFDYQVRATSGSGTRGGFDVTVRFTAGGTATLEAYEVSMKDGSHVHVVDIPVMLVAWP